MIHPFLAKSEWHFFQPSRAQLPALLNRQTMNIYMLAVVPFLWRKETCFLPSCILARRQKQPGQLLICSVWQHPLQGLGIITACISSHVELTCSDCVTVLATTQHDASSPDHTLLLHAPFVTNCATTTRQNIVEGDKVIWRQRKVTQLTAQLARFCFV